MVRIGQYGGGSGRGYGSQQGRADVFRRGRREGDRLKGVVLSELRDGHAWVEVEGQKLLARLEVAASPGDVLEFVLVRLYPEIVLQALRGDGSGQAAGMSAPEVIARYRAARDAFWLRLRESELADRQQHVNGQGGFCSAQTDLPVSREAFIHAASEDMQVLQACLFANIALKPVQSMIEARLEGTLWLAPWRAPFADAVEIFRYGAAIGDATQDAWARLLVSCRLREAGGPDLQGAASASGQILLDIRAGDGVVSFKAYAEHPAILHLPAAVRLTGSLGPQARCLGVERMVFMPGDIPAFLLADTPKTYGAFRSRA